MSTDPRMKSPGLELIWKETSEEGETSPALQKSDKVYTPPTHTPFILKPFALAQKLFWNTDGGRMREKVIP